MPSIESTGTTVHPVRIATALTAQSRISTPGGYLKPEFPVADTVANARKMAYDNWTIVAHMGEDTIRYFYRTHEYRQAGWCKDCGVMTFDIIRESGENSGTE